MRVPPKNATLGATGAGYSPFIGVPPPDTEEIAMNKTDTDSSHVTGCEPPVPPIDLQIESIRRIDGEAALLGHAYILGVLHHAWFVHVEDRDGEQIPVDDPYCRLEDFYRLDADAGPLRTVEVSGFEGDYVVVIYPGSN